MTIILKKRLDRLLQIASDSHDYCWLISRLMLGCPWLVISQHMNPLGVLLRPLTSRWMHSQDQPISGKRHAFLQLSSHIKPNWRLVYRFIYNITWFDRSGQSFQYLCVCFLLKLLWPVVCHVFFCGVRHGVLSQAAFVWSSKRYLKTPFLVYWLSSSPPQITWVLVNLLLLNVSRINCLWELFCVVFNVHTVPLQRG